MEKSWKNRKEHSQIILSKSSDTILCLCSHKRDNFTIYENPILIHFSVEINE